MAAYFEKKFRLQAEAKEKEEEAARKIAAVSTLGHARSVLDTIDRNTGGRQEYQTNPFPTDTPAGPAEVQAPKQP